MVYVLDEKEVNIDHLRETRSYQELENAGYMKNRIERKSVEIEIH